MDSGNSGSLQSSSGDGGATTVEVNPSTHFNPQPLLQPPSNFFNPSSFSPNPNPNPMYNLDSLWSKTSNSDNSYPNSIQDPYLNPNPVDNDDPSPNFGTEKFAKNPKKRTRASRRAPTTVMTTDTANFRQMVQEFTGIPAAPFSSSAYSRRLDLYGAPMQPVRPSAQKIIQLQQPFINSVTATSSFHLHPSESDVFAKQPLSFSNLQNQMFPFQHLSQTSQTTLPQQVNEFASSSSKRWRGENENALNFEGVNENLQNVVVSSSDGDQRQLPGNADSWSFD